MKLEPTNWISIASALIALSAMAVAIWQGYLSRKHNILSVRPKLQIHLNMINGLTLTLQNHGLGPAIIKSFKIRYGANEIINPTSNQYPEIFKSLGIDPNEKEFQYEFHLPFKDTAYVSGQSIRLLQIIPVTENCDESVLMKICDGIKFEIKFTCIYEDKEFLCEG